MSVGELKDWAGVLAFLVSIGTMLFAFVTSKSRANEKTLENVNDRLDRHSNRIQTIENELKHMPAKDDVMQLKLDLSELKGTVGKLGEGMSGMSKTITRVEEFLLNKGGK